MIASDGSVMVLLRKDSSDDSAERSARDAVSSWSASARDSSVRLRRLSSPAVLTNSRMMPLRIIAVRCGCVPASVSLMNWLFCGSVTSTREMSPVDTSRGFTTVKGTTREGPSTFAAGFQPKPTVRPTESPGTPVSTTLPSFVDSVYFALVASVASAYVPERSPGRGESPRTPRIPRELRPQVERELADHVVHDRRALDQIRPRARRDERLSLNRTLCRAAAATDSAHLPRSRRCPASGTRAS